jgi:hypothetical protein
MSYRNKDEIQIESEFNKLNISDENSDINHETCYKPPKKLWCKKCVPHYIIEGWTSRNYDTDEFIKETIYNATYQFDDNYRVNHPLFLEWVSFDRFDNVKQIGEGGFAKVYSATWVDGRAIYIKQDDGSWKKREPKPMKIALKRLNKSQNISSEYLNEVKHITSIFCYFK